jgi:hypothetical protein
MNEELQKSMRTYAWGYFVQHAEQRLKTFNFYVLFCTVIIGAFATLTSKNGSHTTYCVLPLLLPIFSFVFYKLDERTKMLIRNSEQALKYLDTLSLKDHPDAECVLSLIKIDENQTDNLPAYPLFNGGYFSYSRVFRWVFYLMSIIGILGVIYCFTTA